MSDREMYAIDLAFAKLEILELQAGIRELTSCPGIKAVARHIKAAEEKLIHQLTGQPDETDARRKD